MAAVFRELEVSWDGQTYRVKPTMGLLNKIEQDVSLSSVAQRISQGRPPISQLALILAAFLQAGGCKVTSEEVYTELLAGDADVLWEMTGAVLSACFPQKGKAEAHPK